MRRRSRSPQAASAAVVAFLALAAVAPPTPAGFRFEAESAVQANRAYNAGGQERIYATPCGTASGGMAVQGLDAPGDWIEFDLTLTDRFCFLDSLRGAALVGASWWFRVLFIPEGETEPVVADGLPEARGRGVG